MSAAIQALAATVEAEAAKLQAEANRHKDSRGTFGDGSAAHILQLVAGSLGEVAKAIGELPLGI